MCSVDHPGPLQAMGFSDRNALGKVRVAGSSPVARSEKTFALVKGRFQRSGGAGIAPRVLQGEGRPRYMNLVKSPVRRLSPTNPPRR